MRFSLSSATDAAMTKPLALNARTMLLIANGFFSCAHHTSDSKDAYMGGGRSQTSARIVGRHRSVADMFWRFEDLWQSPTGDISHAVKLPVDRTLRPPEIPVYRQARCRGGGYAIETATYTPTVTSVVVASQLDGE